MILVEQKLKIPKGMTKVEVCRCKNPLCKKHFYRIVKSRTRLPKMITVRASNCVTCCSRCSRTRTMLKERGQL